MRTLFRRYPVQSLFWVAETENLRLPGDSCVAGERRLISFIYIYCHRGSGFHRHVAFRVFYKIEKHVAGVFCI